MQNPRISPPKASASAPARREDRTSPIAPAQIFDNLARSLSSGLPRRQVFALAFKGLVGAALAEFGMPSAWAQSTCLCQGQPYDPATACCTASGVQAKHPLTSVAACPGRVPTPGYIATFNGCGPEGSWVTHLIPNRFGLADFTQCCNNHDVCYGTCNDVKSTCDNTFGICLATACTIGYASFALLLPTCLEVAAIYYAAVALGGGGAFESAQDGACDCCSTSTCPQSCAGSACGSLPACAPGGDCVCFTSTEGSGACVHGATPCSSVPRCTTTADCPSGYACLTTSCCGSFGVCGPLCNPILPSAQALPAQVAGQTSGLTLGGF